MRGAPALSIQRLAGHEHLQTTLGYMHLAQGETERAIRLLDQLDWPTTAPATEPPNDNIAATRASEAAQ
jgi:hypothetical protein